MTTVNNTYNCTQLVLHRVISMAKLYNFDDMTMAIKMAIKIKIIYYNNNTACLCRYYNNNKAMWSNSGEF